MTAQNVKQMWKKLIKEIQDSCRAGLECGVGRKFCCIKYMTKI